MEALSILISEIIKKNKWFLIGLFVFGFLVRAFVFNFYLAENNNYWQVDSSTYHKIATNMAQGNGSSVDGSPSFYRLPGYSYFISFYYKYFQTNSNIECFSRKNALWLQVVLASFIPLLIFLLGFILSFGNLLISRLSAIYGAVHLGLVLYSGFFMTESLFIFLFLIFAILFFENLHLFFCNKRIRSRIGVRDDTREKKVIGTRFCSGICDNYGKKYSSVIPDSDPGSSPYLLKLFLAGLFLGLASLVRPVGHYLIFLSILIIFFSRTLNVSSENSFKEKIKKSLALFIGWLVVALPWLLRNYLLLGQIFFHTLPGGHFLHFSAARNVAYEQNCSYDQAKDYLRKKVSKLVKNKKKNIGRNLNEIEVCNLRLKLAVKYFRKHPLLTLKHWLTDILRTTFSLYSAEILYLESGRKSIDYFSGKRTIWDLFKRYLDPPTKNPWLKSLVYLEIFLFLFILLGVYSGFCLALVFLFKLGYRSSACLYFKVLPFIFLFLVIGLAGGYSRMRLPAEPFLIILSFSFYVWVFNLKKLKKENGFT